MPWNLPAGVADTDRRGASGIFISYRRDDASGHVIALMDPLRARFGAAQIFKDTDSIPAGRDFVDEVKRQLTSCAVMLAVIGREWLTVPHPRHGGRRLDDPDDLVRLEVSTALAMRDVLVVPVLVDGATMPSEDDLPPDLRALARRNNVELTNTRWKADTEHLFRVIDQAITASAPIPLWKRATKYSIPLLVTMVLALAGILAVREGRGWFASSAGDDRAAASPVVPGPTTTSPSNQPDPSEPAGGPDPVTGAPPTADTPTSTTGTDGVVRDTSRPPSRPNPGKDRASPPTAAGGPRADEGAGRPAVTDRSPAGIVPHQNDAKDRAGILDVLERFRLAYTAKNEQGVSAVYPDVRTDRMFRDMRDCARVSLVFGEARVNVLSPSEAQVRVPATYGCSPTTAERPMVSPQETDVYMFARRSGVWVIESRLTPVDRKKP